MEQHLSENSFRPRETVRLPAEQKTATKTDTPFSMTDLLSCVYLEGGSDLHLRAGYPPIIRIHGELRRVDGPALSPAAVERMVEAITSSENMVRLRDVGSADFGFTLDAPSDRGRIHTRFRVNALKERGSFALVARNISDKAIPLEELGVPTQAINRFISLRKGLVLVVGPTGSGKSTTLASIIDRINETDSTRHILTIEAPIEFEHKPKAALVTQREVGVDTKSFLEALRDSLREDPNVILVGEMRDPETMDAALQAAETGHLVFATLHTNDAVQTVERIINAFPVNQQNNVRTILSEVLEGVVAQILLPKVDSRQQVIGRVAIFEVLVRTAAIAHAIRDNKLTTIRDEIQTHKKDGMQPMDDSLLTAYKEGWITRERAEKNATHRDILIQQLDEYDRKVAQGEGE